MCDATTSQDDMYPTAKPVVVPVDDDEAIRERFTSTEQLEKWRQLKLSLVQLPSIYLKLSKSRLTGMLIHVYIWH